MGHILSYLSCQTNEFVGFSISNRLAIILLVCAAHFGQQFSFGINFRKTTNA